MSTTFTYNPNFSLSYYSSLVLLGFSISTTILWIVYCGIKKKYFHTIHLWMGIVSTLQSIDTAFFGYFYSGILNNQIYKVTLIFAIMIMVGRITTAAITLSSACLGYGITKEFINQDFSSLVTLTVLFFIGQLITQLLLYSPFLITIDSVIIEFSLVATFPLYIVFFFFIIYSLRNTMSRLYMRDLMKKYKKYLHLSYIVCISLILILFNFVFVAFIYKLTEFKTNTVLTDFSCNILWKFLFSGQLIGTLIILRPSIEVGSEFEDKNYSMEQDFEMNDIKIVKYNKKQKTLQDTPKGYIK